MAESQTMTICCTRPVSLGLEGGTVVEAAPRKDRKGKKLKGPEVGAVISDAIVGDVVEVPWGVGRLLIGSNSGRLVATDHPGQQNPNPEAAKGDEKPKDEQSKGNEPPKQPE